MSQVAGREGDSFASPSTQRERIQAECARQGLDLVAVHEELDVSGGANLDQRPGLGPAVMAVESGDAEVIVAAYFDRFFRGLEVQSEVLRRVEAAGGEVLAVDSGVVSHGTTSQWLSASVSGLLAEHQRRAAAERTAEAIQAAILRGVPPWPRITAGYRKRADKTYEPDPVTAPVVRRAFELRAQSVTVREVRAYLQEHGIAVSYAGASKLLSSRVVLGEIHFGGFIPNLAAHEAIVSRDVWETVQRTRVPAGRNTKSERLLARLGVLVCGTCSSRLVTTIAIGQGGRYPIYRCQNVDCSRRVTISAPRAEAIVSDAVRSALADAEGRASAETHAREAEAGLETAQGALDAAVRTFEVLGDEMAARTKLLELRAVRDHAREQLERLGSQRAAVVVNASRDWELLTLGERRALIRATVERVTVAPGRGADRCAVLLFGQ